jgi:hypothetical protein
LFTIACSHYRTTNSPSPSVSPDAKPAVLNVADELKKRETELTALQESLKKKVAATSQTTTAGSTGMDEAKIELVQKDIRILKRLLAAGKTVISTKSSAACSECCCASGSYGACVSKEDCANIGGTCVDAAPGC